MEVSIKQIYQAYKKCHLGKTKTPQAQIYSANLIDNIFDTYLVLHLNKYYPKPYTCFIASNGSKPREVHAADFFDRVVYNFYQKLNTWYQDNVISIKNGRLFRLNSKNSTYLNSLFASYLGHFKHARYYKILQSKKQQFPWLNLFFYQKNNQYYSTTYCQFASKFSHQVSFFNHFFQGFVVLIQKGKNFIINNDNNQMPLKYLSTYLQKLHYQQQSYIFVSEQGYVHNRLKQRRVRQLFISNQSSFI